MLHHPDVMKEAQDEVDSVVGTSRMPEFSDMESMPYMTALIKEVARYVSRCAAVHCEREQVRIVLTRRVLDGGQSPQRASRTPLRPTIRMTVTSSPRARQCTPTSSQYQSQPRFILSPVVCRADSHSDSAMMQDEQMFPEPETFRPERFLDTDNPRLQNFTLHFGFGRRICPGMYIANQAVFIVLARCAPSSSSSFSFFIANYIGWHSTGVDYPWAS